MQRKGNSTLTEHERQDQADRAPFGSEPPGFQKLHLSVSSNASLLAAPWFSVRLPEFPLRGLRGSGAQLDHTVVNFLRTSKSLIYLQGAGEF